MQTEQTRNIVDRFVNDLTSIIQTNAREAILSAFRGASPQRAQLQPASFRRVPLPLRALGAKRSPDALALLTEKLRTYVAKHPGQRIEQIGKAMNIGTRELALPARKLIAEKKLTTKGHKRATTYFAKG